MCAQCKFGWGGAQTWNLLWAWRRLVAGFGWEIVWALCDAVFSSGLGTGGPNMTVCVDLHSSYLSRMPSQASWTSRPSWPRPTTCCPLSLQRQGARGCARCSPLMQLLCYREVYWRRSSVSQVLSNSWQQIGACHPSFSNATIHSTPTTGLFFLSSYWPFLSTWWVTGMYSYCPEYLPSPSLWFW